MLITDVYTAQSTCDALNAPGFPCGRCVTAGTVAGIFSILVSIASTILGASVIRELYTGGERMASFTFVVTCYGVIAFCSLFALVWFGEGCYSQLGDEHSRQFGGAWICSVVSPTYSFLLLCV